MRLDFWFFQGYLLGMGSLTELYRRSHNAIEVALSFNQPMKVTIKGVEHSCSLLAVDSDVPHVIDGTDGWQFFGYLHPDSHLGKLVHEKISQNGKGWIMEEAEFLHGREIELSANNEPTPYKIRELFETLLSHLLGIKSFSLGWNGELKTFLDSMESFPISELNQTSLGEKMNLSPSLLAERFYQLTGIPLTHFIFNRKLVNTFLLIKKDLSLREAVEMSGLSGVFSATSYITDLYGLDMETLLTENSLVRFFPVCDPGQISGHGV